MQVLVSMSACAGMGNDVCASLSPNTQVALPGQSAEGLHQALKCKPRYNSMDHGTAKAGKKQHDMTAVLQTAVYSAIYSPMDIKYHKSLNVA